MLRLVVLDHDFPAGEGLGDRDELAEANAARVAGYDFSHYGGGATSGFIGWAEQFAASRGVGTDVPVVEGRSIDGSDQAILLGAKAWLAEQRMDVTVPGWTSATGDWWTRYAGDPNPPAPPILTTAMLPPTAQLAMQAGPNGITVSGGGGANKVGRLLAKLVAEKASGLAKGLFWSVAADATLAIGNQIFAGPLQPGRYHVPAASVYYEPGRNAVHVRRNGRWQEHIAV